MPRNLSQTKKDQPLAFDSINNAVIKILTFKIIHEPLIISSALILVELLDQR